MSVQASDRSDDGSIEDREQVDYENDEQVDDEQVDDEQVVDEQVADKQVADKQVADEQVVDEQVAEKQVGKQASKGPKPSPKHIRFAKGKSVSEGLENSGTSSEEERPSSPLKFIRRKKRSIEEQMADEAKRRAHIDGNSAFSSLEFLTSLFLTPLQVRQPLLPQVSTLRNRFCQLQVKETLRNMFHWMALSLLTKRLQILQQLVRPKRLRMPLHRKKREPCAPPVRQLSLPRKRPRYRRNLPKVLW